MIAYSLAIPNSEKCCLIYPDSEKNKDNEDDGYTVVRNVLKEDSSTIKLYTRTICLFKDENEDFKPFIKRIKEEEIKPMIMSLLNLWQIAYQVLEKIPSINLDVLDLWSGVVDELKQPQFLK